MRVVISHVGQPLPDIVLEAKPGVKWVVEAIEWAVPDGKITWYSNDTPLTGPINSNSGQHRILPSQADGRDGKPLGWFETAYGEALKMGNTAAEITAGSMTVREETTPARGPMRIVLAHTGDANVAPAKPGVKYIVESLQYTPQVSGNVQWKSGSTAITGDMPVIAEAHYVYPAGIDGRDGKPVGWFETGYGEALNVTSDTLISGCLTVREEVEPRRN